ncbi:amidohydrolase [Georgenia yuyongxinii]|uniref:Amidohydrolase n=1 Tax=Georgenia yuyongxinii TaxID=2589797 RepID=A0A5B8C627_9MICO|nr:amidohydrolase family protein [Georgenia yuyongxinii]QDC25667.1 amidohydrolase [Georgenia yuyongxinii]
MRVDWHSHVWEPRHLGPTWGPELDANVGAHPSRDGSWEAHQLAMAEGEIDAAVVVALVACEIDLDIPNEYVAEYAATHPGRIVGFGSVDPADPHAVARVHHAADLGLRGLKLSPPYQGFHPHSDAAWAVYTAAADRGLALMFHQGGVFLRGGALEYAQPILLDRVARSFRDTSIIIAHAGQPWSHETAAVMFKNPNVWTDLSARYGRPHQLATILRGLTDYGVGERVLFGSDFPIYTPADCIRQLRDLVLSPPAGAPPVEPPLVDQILDARPLSILFPDLHPALSAERKDPS